MVWVLRRVLIPFAAGGVVGIALLLAWTVWGSDTEVSVGLHDLALAALFVLPFQAAGLAILVPIALFLCDLPLPRPLYPALLAVVGAAFGIAVVLPISDRPHFLDFTLPATCGALSALVWFAFNQDAMKRRV
jgi:peptidoglycan/LPS O-acetylase OafA/YrhL